VEQKMNKLNRMLISISLLLAACAGITAPSQLAQTEAQEEATNLPHTASSEGIHLLLVAEGNVELRRRQWQEFRPTAFGAILYHRDELKIANSADALVLCGDLTPWPVTPGTFQSVTNGCPDSDVPSIYIEGEGNIDTPRAAPTDIPYIIYPRATSILTNQPLLRWHAPENASYYTVIIRSDDFWWETQTDKAEIVYSGDQPLEPGISYKLVVEADNGHSSSEEEIPSLGFSLLDEAATHSLMEDVERIRNLDLTYDAERYAIALMYAGQGLYADGVALLEELAEAGTQSQAVYYHLGRLYLRMYLAGSAKEALLRAAELAEAVQDLDTLARVRESLAQVSDGNSRPDELKAARAAYEALGDLDAVERIDGLLAPSETAE
jgi:hypothetical protein